jgi:hypothetical protein
MQRSEYYKGSTAHKYGPTAGRGDGSVMVSEHSDHEVILSFDPDAG